MVIMAQRSAAADEHSRPLDPQIYVRATDKTAVAALMAVAGLEFDPIPVEDYECEFDDGTPMAFEQLARYLITGRIHAILQDQDGAILHYGRGLRWFTNDQKHAASYRDRWCKCGCGLLARLCDLDHVVEWKDLGLTNLGNAGPQCRGSHTPKTVTNQRKRRRRRRSGHNEDNTDPDG